MRIVDLVATDEPSIQQCASLLVECFDAHPDDWPDMASALEDMQDCLQDGRIIRVAVEEPGLVLGWIGARPAYSKSWELHPLVVRPDRQRQGIGRALVADLEERVRERGALTLRLDTDDHNYQTTVSGVDLYPDPLAHLARIRNERDHPYEFYQKQGFSLIGILPDATGWGRPDIMMAKRIQR
jgi:aminoglycoside 6'-N-acetyltransferase I